MPTLSTFYGIVVMMYYNDHSPPHFHVSYAEYRAKIDLEYLNVIAGNVPRRALRLIREWAELHRDELDATWARAQNEEPPGTIDPLP